MQSSMRNRLRNLEALARKPLRDDGFPVITEVAQKVWESLNTPLSLGLSLLARNGQWKDVVSQEYNPGRYLETELETARDDYQAVALLRKFPLNIDGIDRKGTALKKFLEAEEQCRTTNARFRSMREGKTNPLVEPVLLLAQQKISRWLGEAPSAKSWAARCRFGPGADNLNKGNRVGPYHKLSQLSATADFADSAQALVLDHPAWAKAIVRSPIPSLDEMPRLTYQYGYIPVGVAAGNKVTFVPKSALTDRSIAIEPQMNIFAQLGLGSLLRSRLKRAGLNLDDQGPNQVLAQKGSIDGTVATIDLSMASDTLAREVVRELLPEGWYFALDLCRSKNGTYGDGGGAISFRYEKFSSMGNGFTFELESMIFYALALSVCDQLALPKVLVRSYGDDITIPVEAVALLVEVLGFCGFLVNKEKSYVSPIKFRESCGADFFNGVNVRPYFQKEYLSDATSLFRMANGIRRVAARRNHGYGCDERLRPAWLHVIHRIPGSLRDLKGPFRIKAPPEGGTWYDVESGDGYLAVGLDEALSSPWVRRRKPPEHMSGWVYAELGAKPVIFTATDWERLLVTALYLCRDGIAEKKKETIDQLPDRGSNPRRLNRYLTIPDWLDLGPWL